MVAVAGPHVGRSVPARHEARATQPSLDRLPERPHRVPPVGQHAYGLLEGGGELDEEVAGPGPSRVVLDRLDESRGSKPEPREAQQALVRGHVRAVAGLYEPWRMADEERRRPSQQMVVRLEHVHRLEQRALARAAPQTLDELDVPTTRRRAT